MKKKTLKERLWKSLNIIVAVAILLNISGAAIWFHPSVARATDGSTWPTDNQWVSPVCNDDPANDESPSWVDLKAAGAEYGVAYYTDATNLYLRERVDANPGTPGNWNEHAWVFIIQKDPGVSQYDYLVSLRGSGSGENVELWENTTKNGPINFSPLFNDPAETMLQSWSTSDHSRVTAIGSDYYVDWQIPRSSLPDVNLLTSGLFFATSANANNYNKDHLDCYNAPQITLQKELQKNHAGAWVTDGRTSSPILTAAPGDVITYRVTVTNSGGPATSPITVVDELGRGGSGDGSANINPSTQYSNWTSVSNLNSDGLGMAFTGSWGDGAADSQANDTLTVAIPSMAGGGVSEQFTFDATIRADLPVGTTLLENTATSGQLTAETDIQVIRTGVCNLVVTKSVNTLTAAPGDILTYTINYVNNGTAFCTGGGVLIYDTLSTGMTYVANSARVVSVTNDQDFNTTDPAPEVLPTFTGKTTQTQLGNLHEIGPNESGVLELKAKVDTGTECSVWDVQNSGRTDGDQVTSDVTFSSPITHITAACSTTLTVIKHVINDNGGTKVAANFTMHISGTAGSAAFAGAENPGVMTNLVPGSYSVSEDAVAGYAATYSADCSGALTLGQKKTCTVTNNDIQPKLTVTKVVINDNGGTKVVNDFPLFVNATGVTSGTQNGFNAGTYTISETSQSGYVGVISGDCSSNGSVTLAVGETKACTITNNDQASTLIVKKVVINDNGGNAVVTDFSFKVNNGNSIAFESDAQNDLSVNAGTYSVVENSATGYTTSYSNCSNVVIPNGGSATCTITNNDVAPTITLNKVVINDNGGNAGVHDFGLTVGGSAVNSGQTVSVNANTPVTLNESGLTGYTFVSITGDNACPSVLNGTVTLNEGQNITCTITNNDVAPRLTVIKHVINLNGGILLASNFTMNVAGINASPASFPGSETGTAVTLNQGVYIVTETPVPGYDPVYSSDCSSTIAVGESKTCTVTNTAIAPHLIVIKHVVTDNGGTAVASDFTLTINGVLVPSGATFAGAEAPGVDKIVLPGSYTVTEPTNTAYATSYSPDCMGMIALGETKICTITNNDIAPQVTVIKHVINDNGGTAIASDFTMNVTGTSVSNPSFAGSETGVTVTLNQGAYSVDESAMYGYAKTLSTDCTGTIAVGQTKTCTITNNDIQPKLTVTKVVINDNGGTKVVSDFPLFVNTTAVTSGVQNGFNAGSYTVSETQDNGYTVVISGDCTSNGSVGLNVGDTKSCTITNDDIQPKLTVTKVVINNNGGTKVVSDFPLFVDQTLVTSGVQNGFNADSYTVSETNQAGYTSVISGDCSLSGSVTLNPGDVKSCTITNDDITPTITLIKNVVNNNGGTAGVNDFGLTIGGISVTSGQVLSVNANQAYALNEAGKVGYQFISMTGSGEEVNLCPNVLNGSVTLTPGQHLTCTITNDDIQPRLTVTKVVINDEGGTKVVSDFPLFVGPTAVTSGVQNGFNVGTYAITETSFSNYVASFSGDCNAQGQVSLGAGEVKSCTITNNDIAPRLSIVKSNNVAGFTNPGKTVTYTVVVSNSVLATDIARAVNLTDLLPAGFTFVDGGLGTKTFGLGDIAPGASVTTTYVANISASQAAGTYTNTASAQGSNTTNVSATSNVEVRIPEILGAATSPELTITKRANPTVTNPGRVVAYTVVVKNVGQADAMNVVVTDTLPQGFTFVDSGKATKTWKLGTLEINHERVLNYQVKVGENVKAGKYTNVATVTSDGLSQTARATVEVKVPKVLGLATTGASVRDYAFFVLGLSLIALGGLWITRQQRHRQTTAV